MKLEQNLLKPKPQQDSYSARYAQIAAQMIDRLESPSLLIYGDLPDGFLAGFRPSKPCRIQKYKPTIIGGEKADPSSVVVSVDFLNTCGQLGIETALTDLQRATLSSGFFKVRLPRQGDISTKDDVDHPDTWWLDQFARKFYLHTYQVVPDGFYVICYARG